MIQKAAPLALALLSACAPEKVDMYVHDIFTGDAARYALQTQMPAAQLAEVGGFLPATTWPSDAAPLLLDVQVIAENKIDLASSNITASNYSGLRLHWAELAATALGDGALAPRPSTVEVWVGPAAATALTDNGVLPLASGAFPASVSTGDCDGGSCSPSDGGVAEPDADAGMTFDVDQGQTLVFSSDAQLTLANLAFAGQPFALFVVLHIPIDSAVNPSLPTGGVDLSFDIQFELAR